MNAAMAQHTPVLLDRCLDLLAPAIAPEGAVLVDGTLGLGGHSAAILKRFPKIQVIGIDRDPQALELATKRVRDWAGGRFEPVQATFDQIPQVLAAHGYQRAEGILLDLGVSSLQLDQADRGFAYAQDAPLDMRMDPATHLTAAMVLNSYPEHQIARILREYGEERFASRIAARIVARRESACWERSSDLADLVRDAIPAAARKTGGHPAKRTFQALRIEVNQELDLLGHALPSAIGALAIGGRLVVESYHSLEDRLVKQAMSAGLKSSAPLGLPVELAQHRPYLRALTHGAEKADAAEVACNPRAASVRLRAVEKVREVPTCARQSNPKPMRADRREVVA